MALTATQHTVDLTLSDVDRGVYDSLTLRLARHPSESAPYLVARALAFALEQRDGLAFSKGLSVTDEPAVWAHDPTGALTAWIEVGTPDAARLHKARKATDDVAVYCHKDPAPWLRALTGQRVHEASSLRLYALDRKLVEALADTLDRRAAWSVTRSEGVLYVATDTLEVEAPLESLPWPG